MQSVSKQDTASSPIFPEPSSSASASIQKGPRKKRRRPAGKKRKNEAFPYVGKRWVSKPAAAVVAVAFLADAPTRSILQSPRIETRQFFQPHEIRAGHKFLLSESRRSFEETLRDVPDIETKELEKIVRNDLERAIGREFWKSPTVIAIIQTV